MYKKKSVLFILILFIMFFVTCFGYYFYGKVNVSDEDEAYKKIDLEDFVVEISNNYYGDCYVLEVGEKFKPTLTFYPDNLSQYDKNVFWSTSNSNIISIDYFGNITALKKGTAVVNITSSKNKDISKSIKLMVVEKNNTLVFHNSYYNSEKVYSVGQISKIDYTIDGKISLDGITWSSSNQSVVTVEDGYLIANSIGTAIVTATSLYDDTYTTSFKAVVRGKYTSVMPNEIIFGKYFIVDNYKYSEEEFNSVNKYVDNVIEISATTDQEMLSNIIFNISGGKYEIVDLSDEKIVFIPKEIGQYTINLQSSLNPALKRTITFETKYKRIIQSIKLSTIDDTLIEDVSGIKCYKMSFGEFLPIILETKDSVYDYNDFNITTSNSNCIKIEDGYIKAVGIGFSDIEIVHKVNSEIKYNLRINVLNKTINNYNRIKFIQMSNNDYEFVDYDINKVFCDSIVDLTFLCYPIYATNSSLSNVYLTNDDLCDVKKAYIDGKLDVMVNFLKPGFTSLIIECVEDPNLSLQYDFEIVNKDEVNFSFNPVKLLERGQTGNCNVVLSDGLKGVDVSYTSSDPSIVSVGHAGEMVGLGYGNATITVYATDGVSSHTESFEVECVKEHSLYDALKTFKSVVKMDNKEISLSEKLMYIGDSFTIDVSFTPSNHPFGKYHEVKVEKPDILSVDKNNNKYTFNCLKSGTTKVIVYPYANPDFSIEYTVTIANIMPEFMFVSIPDKVMYVEDRYQFGYLVDWRATYSKVDVIIGDESIVEIVDDYLVIKNPGKTYVSFVIDDNDDNTVSYVQTLEIEAFEHSNGVKLERYGYGNFIVRIISQVLCALIIGILGSVIASYKPFKTSQILNDVLVMGILLIVLILCNVVRISITSLKYEKYDLLISVSSYLVGLVIGFIVNVIKKRKGDVNNA